MNVFLLGTPLQALGAIEAQRVYQSGFDQSVALIGSKAGSSRRAISQLNSALELGNWTEVHRVQADLVLDWHRQYARNVDDVTAAHPNIDTVFMGSYRSAAMNHAVRRLKPKRIVLLDDGVATLAVAEERLQGMHTLPAQGFLKGLGLRLTGLELAKVQALEFFSTYDLNVEAPDSYRRCTYETLKAALSDKQVGRSVLLLGTPASEDGIMSAQKYLQVLKAVSVHFESREVTYFAHRRESTTTLKDIASIPGFVLSEPTACFEMALVNSQQLPAVVAGLFSSGLTTASRLIGLRSEVQAFRIAQEHVEERYKPGVKSAYASLSADPNIRVIEMEG